MRSAVRREGGGFPVWWREALSVLAPSGSAAAAGGGAGGPGIAAQRVGSDRGRCWSCGGARPLPSALTAFALAAAAGSARSPRLAGAGGGMAGPAGGLEDAELREAQRDYLDFLDDEVRPGVGLRWGMGGAAFPSPPPMPRGLGGTWFLCPHALPPPRSGLKAVELWRNRLLFGGWDVSGRGS